jgi:hypothetical protein
MMKIKLLVAAIASTTLAGCANNDYKLYVETQAKIAMAQAMAEKARYEAIQDVGDNSDVSRVAAVMALQNRGSAAANTTQLKEPESWLDKAYKWTTGLLPGTAQIYGIYKNGEVQMQASNNARDIRINTNETMVDMVHGETFVTQPIIIEDADGNQSAVNPVVDRQ